MRWLAVGLVTAALTAAWLGYGLPEAKQYAGQRVVVITGATQGLGRKAAEMFAQRGDKVFACGRSKKHLAELDRIKNVNAVHCDVADEVSVQKFADTVKESLAAGESVDCVINNAGILLVGHPMLAAETSAFDLSWHVNTRGPFFVSRAFIPLMRPRGRDVPAPVIINLGSTTETPKIAQAFHGMYQMSKVALRAFSNAIRQEARLKGVRVSHIRAGAFDTDLHHSFSNAGEVLKRYGGEYEVHAPKAQKLLTENLKMVWSAPAADLAELLWKIAHSENPRDEYDFNVSWLEELVAYLPQRILDEQITGAYL